MNPVFTVSDKAVHLLLANCIHCPPDPLALVLADRVAGMAGVAIDGGAAARAPEIVVRTWRAVREVVGDISEADVREANVFYLAQHELAACALATT